MANSLSLHKSEGSSSRQCNPIVKPLFPPKSEQDSSSSRQHDPVGVLSKGEGSLTLHGKRKRAPSTPSSSDVEIIPVESPVAIRSPARKRVSRGKGNLLYLILLSHLR